MTALHDYLVDPTLPPTADDMVPPYAFRYMGGDGLLHTVTNQTLRMNTWSQMNDPRESKEWSAPGLVATGHYTYAQMQARFDAVVRRSACLLSLTMDRQPDSSTTAPHLFHRGWARAALWAHYAQQHAGVCLVLDTALVMESAMDRLPPKNLRYTQWGRVVYADEPVQLELSGRFAAESELNAAIEELLDRRGKISSLHMTKNKDWEYEVELRLSVIDAAAEPADLDRPLYVPLNGCLRGVIFGENHPAPEMVAAGAQKTLPSDPPEFFRCRWDAGAPLLEPLAV